MKKKLFYIACAGCCAAIGNLFSCSHPQSEGNRIGKQLYTMQELSHKTFALDDSTTQVIPYMQAYEKEGKSRLSIYNEPTNNICIFDVNSGKGIAKIQLQTEGPNAVGKDVRGYFLVDEDSAFIYQYWTETLSLVDRKGVIIRKYELEPLMVAEKDGFCRPEPLPNTSLPIKMIQGRMILQGQGGVIPEGSENVQRAVTAIYNLQTNDIQYRNPYPSVYGEGESKKKIWQTFAYRVVPYDLTPAGEMVLSYPADDSVRIYNPLTEETKSCFAGYSQNLPIRPAASPGKRDVEEHVLQQMQYAGIYYDRWNDLYYRVVTLPVGDYDVNEKKAVPRSLAVVILDKDFQKVGEYNVKEQTYTYAQCFVSEGGLHIHTMTDNDDLLSFITLKVQKLN